MSERGNDGREGTRGSEGANKETALCPSTRSAVTELEEEIPPIALPAAEKEQLGRSRMRAKVNFLWARNRWGMEKK